MKNRVKSIFPEKSNFISFLLKHFYIFQHLCDAAVARKFLNKVVGFTVLGNCGLFVLFLPKVSCSSTLLLPSFLIQCLNWKVATRIGHQITRPAMKFLSMKLFKEHPENITNLSTRIVFRNCSLFVLFLLKVSCSSTLLLPS